MRPKETRTLTGLRDRRTNDLFDNLLYKEGGGMADVFLKEEQVDQINYKSFEMTFAD